ncbi:MutS-related protein [Anaerovoracaceae bacterium SGI.195]
MIKNDNRRLANVKTRHEAGLDYVKDNIVLNSPFSSNLIKEMKPYFPGDEDALMEHFDKLEQMVNFVVKAPKSVERISEFFMEMKDCRFSITRASGNTLSAVEFFELKSLLIQMTRIRGEMANVMEAGISIPDEYILEDVENVLDILDPRHDRIHTFYVYDEFSPKLAEMRRKRKDLEKKARKMQRATKDEIKHKYGITLTPKFDIVLSKSCTDYKIIDGIPELAMVGEDHLTASFELKPTPEALKIINEIEDITTEIEDEELKVLEGLSKAIAKHTDVLLSNIDRIAALDLMMGRAIFADEKKCVRPEIVKEHVIEFKNARHLQVEEVLSSKGKKYKPISMSLKSGVSCITGANMGGKTISLKLSGMIALMAQYGFFVPCEEAKIGLSGYMQMLIGDSQSVERGLSSFGSEMEELKEILDNSVDRSMLLIDEIASGTNPVEGLALTRSLVDYLKDRPYISLITTHFETVTEDEGVTNMQVRGLKGVDFSKLDKEIRYANRRERIDIIGKYMDYSLDVVKGNREVPKDALNIAKMLGINKEIIEGAQKYIK